MAITVVVSGAKGRMGTETVGAVMADDQLQLVGEVDHGDDLAATLGSLKPVAMVDFSVPSAVLGNIETALANGVVPIVGTTGLAPADVEYVRGLCRTHNLGALIAPNFAIGALLMMRFAQEAAKYMPDAEIIEMHHEKKLDAPSGTAAKTAEMIAIGRANTPPTALPDDAFEKIPGSRGGKGVGDVPVHSVRLPGFVASQMVIFGGPGQTLTIRHDSLDRKSFMPGVTLALRHAPALAANGGELIYGLEHLL
ncbi:4-hydroxy-tetrahydrodipicolinate reductase [Capsulimonas corticalis]|uniref:4-hydroxy-tetrahydrodipicolinate reductase n=1 Tax=Capsulimonas corticalis TaxID=2219043 RepID=A0A402CXI8_9BACT|nr:4-hydroxy-tetrahydrodipicolinate reductase [Capsulimonas corticalis]BDI32266.1 4-hydroxy-tetrahydrodipicolinate reductase [Capsulimonas corticalis]